jgi:hypothetical protein
MYSACVVTMVRLAYMYTIVGMAPEPSPRLHELIDDVPMKGSSSNWTSRPYAASKVETSKDPSFLNWYKVTVSADGGKRTTIVSIQITTAIKYRRGVVSSSPQFQRRSGLERTPYSDSMIDTRRGVCRSILQTCWVNATANAPLSNALKLDTRSRESDVTYGWPRYFRPSVGFPSK